MRPKPLGLPSDTNDKAKIQQGLQPPQSSGESYLIVYDFDCTLSAQHVFSVTNGHQGHNFEETYTLNDVIGWFGGEDRVARLKQHFVNLGEVSPEKPIELIIISYGYVATIKACLQMLDLLVYVSQVYGRDSKELLDFRGDKSQLIEKLMAERSVSKGNCVFIDDTEDNVEKAKNKD